MVSISLLGLLEPILLQRPAMGMGVILICGLNRLEACRRLKMRAILARVVNGNTPEINSWCEKAELDENNVRRIGSPPSGSNVVPLMTARG
jgi:ParB-like chromosome segregation protein Spo0J